MALAQPLSAPSEIFNPDSLCASAPLRENLRFSRRDDLPGRRISPAETQRRREFRIRFALLGALARKSPGFATTTVARSKLASFQVEFTNWDPGNSLRRESPGLSTIGRPVASDVPCFLMVSTGCRGVSIGTPSPAPPLGGKQCLTPASCCYSYSPQVRHSHFRILTPSCLRIGPNHSKIASFPPAVGNSRFRCTIRRPPTACEPRSGN